MRTQGLFYADTPHSGGWLFAELTDLLRSSANLLQTYSAQGLAFLSRTAAGAESYTVRWAINGLFRLLETMQLQEQFGGTGPGPASVAGFPPFTDATELVPPTTATPKGIEVTDIVTVYNVGVVALVSMASVLVQTVFANNVAPAVTTPTLSAATYPLLVQANPYVVVQAVTTPTFLTTDLSVLAIETTFALANTGTIQFSGVGCHLKFNYD